MTKVFKRILALFLVLVINFTCLVVPASATVASAAASFSDWCKEYITMSFWRELFSSDDPVAAYDAYAARVTDALGASTVGDNCVYLGNWSLIAESVSDVKNVYFSSGSSLRLTCDSTNSNGYPRVLSTFVAPVSGQYTFTCFGTSSNSSGSTKDPFSTYRLWEGEFSTGTQLGFGSGLHQTCSVELVAGHTYVFDQQFSVRLSTGTWSISYACRVQYPTDGVINAAGDVPISTETRTGSLCGDFFYSGDNGEMMLAENQYIVNEGAGTITLPGGTTENMIDWYYDYADRSYHVTTDNGTYTVIYGDESVTVDNGTTVNNYYYYVSSSGSGGSGGGTTDPDTPSDDSGTTIGGLIESLLSGVGDIVGGLIKGILSLLTKAVEAVAGIGDLFASFCEKVVGLFGGFTSFLAAVFPFLPEEFFVILNLGLILLIAAAVIKRFLGG